MKRSWWIVPLALSVCIGTADNWSIFSRIFSAAVAVLMIVDIAVYLKKIGGGHNARGKEKDAHEQRG